MAVEYKLYHGGLMRCCIATLADAMEATTEPPKEGDTLMCKYCHHTSMVFRDGAWRWVGPGPWEVG